MDNCWTATRDSAEKRSHFAGMRRSLDLPPVAFASQDAPLGFTLGDHRGIARNPIWAGLPCGGRMSDIGVQGIGSTGLGCLLGLPLGFTAGCSWGLGVRRVFHTVPHIGKLGRFFFIGAYDVQPLRKMGP